MSESTQGTQVEASNLLQMKTAYRVFYGFTDQQQLIELGSVYLADSYLAGLDDREECKTVETIHAHLQSVYGEFLNGEIRHVALAAARLLKLYNVRRIEVLATLLTTAPNILVVDTLLKDRSSVGKTLSQIWSMEDGILRSFIKPVDPLSSAVGRALSQNAPVLDFNDAWIRKMRYEQARHTLHPVVDSLPDKTPNFVMGFEAGIFFKNLTLELASLKDPKAVRFQTRVHTANIEALRRISQAVKLELYHTKAHDTGFSDVIVAHPDTVTIDQPKD